MSKKQFLGKTCPYCCVPGSSSTADHIVARQFFLNSQRMNLPKLPACAECNTEKSKLEHYLGTILPFGGMHQDAHETIETFVPGRLKKNQRLHRELALGITERSAEGSSTIEAMTVPIDSGKLLALYEYIARGLSAWHWEVLLPPTTHTVSAGFLTAYGAQQFAGFFAEADEQVVRSLGEGVFRYSAIRFADPEGLALWTMSFYGAMLADDTEDKKITESYVITAPKTMLASHDFVRRLTGHNSGSVAIVAQSP